MRQLLIGCGTSRERMISPNGSPAWDGLITLDMNPEVGPDVVHDLEDPELPFEDNSLDEIHAYDVLEHSGRQGDWRGFFRQWDGFWRVLKPGGLFCGISPTYDSLWAWGDPGHTRIIGRECLVFLDRTKYGTPPMTDYRPWYAGDFDIVWLSGADWPAGKHGFILRAVKPARGER